MKLGTIWFITKGKGMDYCSLNKVEHSRLSAVEANGCQFSRPLRWGPTLGAYVGLEGGARMWRLNTGPPMGSQKWTGATQQERAEPHRQFTGIDDFIACAISTMGPRGRHQGRQHTKTILVLAWRYWTVCRSLRIDLSGPHQAVLSMRHATCWRLFPLFNNGPTCLSLKIIIWIYMYDDSEVYVPSCSLWGRELGQQVHMLWLFSQDFFKGSRARMRYWCRNVAWLHLAWAGVYFPPSPPPRDLVVHACAPLLAYVPRGVGGMQLADFTWCMGAWPPPYPSIGSCTRATIRQYNFQFSIIISN